MEGSRTGPAGGRVARNTTLLTAALIGQKILSFLYVLILARLIGVTSSGDLYGSLSFIVLFSVFVDLGLTPALIRQTARDAAEGGRNLRTIVAMKIVTGLLVGIAMIGIVAYLHAIGRFGTDLVYIQVAAVIMVIDSFVITFLGYMRGIERLEYESLTILIHRVTIMLVGITSLMLGAPAIWSMFAVLAGSLVNVLYVTIQLWKRQVSWMPAWSWRESRRLLRTALPFGVAALFIAIYSSSDNILLQLSHGRLAVGLYATTSKIIAAFNQIFPAALVAAIFPAMSASFIRDRERMETIFRDAVKYLIIISVPLVVILLTLAGSIVSFWPDVWKDAIWPLRMLALGLPFLFLNYPVGYLLNAANLQSKNTMNVAITVCTNIGLNLLFVGQYSYRSVAIISVLSSALLVILGLRYVRKVISIPFRTLGAVAGKAGVAGLLVAAMGWVLLPSAATKTGAVGVAAVMGMVYILSIFAFRLLRWEQMVQILQKFRRA